MNEIMVKSHKLERSKTVEPCLDRSVIEHIKSYLTQISSVDLFCCGRIGEGIHIFRDFRFSLSQNLKAVIKVKPDLTYEFFLDLVSPRSKFLHGGAFFPGKRSFDNNRQTFSREDPRSFHRFINF